MKLATEAAVDTEEFADKLFTSRLEKAINVDDIYTFRANGQGQVTTVKIDLASSAGNLEDYFNAVELLREEMGWGDSDPRNASLFWRALYDLAHGGTISSPILRKKIKRGMWKETVRLRIGHYSELAPFWELIDKGNIGIGHGRGGKPHPYYGPSHFLESATVQAKVLFTAEYEKRKANLKAALERDSYGLKDFIQSFPGVFRGQPIRQVSGSVRRAVPTIRRIIGEIVGQSKESFQPGEIIGYLEIGAREYEIYITKKQKDLGLRAR